MKRTRFLIFCSVIVGFPTSVLSESDRDCVGYMHIENALGEYDTLCTEEFASCKADRIDKFGDNDSQAGEACNRPLPSDPRFIGPCPAVMEMLEKSEHRDKRTTMAKAWLRMNFDRVNEEGAIEPYKLRDSVVTVRELLTKDPDSYNLNSFLHHSFSFNEDLVVEPLKMQLKMLTLDSACHKYWFFHISNVTDLVMQLVTKHESGALKEGTFSDDEVGTLVENAWDALSTLYKIAYTSSENVRKISYALQEIRHPFFSEDVKATALIGNFLGINPIDYESERLDYYVSDLTKLYSDSSLSGRQQSLGMICNDYAFEMTLVDYCMKLIEYYAMADVENGISLKQDISEASIILISAASRNCDEYLGLRTEYWQNSVESGLCLNSHYKSYVDRIRGLLAGFTSKESNEHKYILNAYLDLDGSSVESYEQALEIDGEMYEHGGWLAKRLQQRGHENAAALIAERTIEYASRDRPNGEMDEIEHRFFIENLEKMRDMLSEGRAITLGDSPRFLIEYNN